MPGCFAVGFELCHLEIKAIAHRSVLRREQEWKPFLPRLD